MDKGATSDAGKYLFITPMCGGVVRSIWLLPLVARCLETIDVCIWRKFVCMSLVVMCGGLWDSMLYVCVRDVMDVVFFVCIVTRGAVCTRVWEVGVFRHADVCLCHVCILWQFLMLHGCIVV